MIWVLFAVTLNVLFAIAAAAIWTNHFASWKVRSQKREVGYLRDEIQIDPAKVAPFKATWPDTR